MEQGYVLLASSPMKEKEVREALTAKHNVLEWYDIFGEYDIIVKGEAENMQKLETDLAQIIGVIDYRSLGKILENN